MGNDAARVMMAEELAILTRACEKTIVVLHLACNTTTPFQFHFKKRHFYHDNNEKYNFELLINIEANKRQLELVYWGGGGGGGRTIS